MPILGVGVDIVSVERIKSIWHRYKKRFEKKVFTPKEIHYAFEKKFPFYTLSGYFAIKEAYYKAIGGYSGFSFQDIEILHHKNGAPFLNLKNKAFVVNKEKGVKKVWISISHEKEYAIGIVVLEG